MTKIHRLSHFILFFALLCFGAISLQGCSETLDAAKTWKGALPNDPDDPTANRPDRMDVTDLNVQTKQGTQVTQEAKRVLPPVKVAILLPLSGQHKSIGQAMLQAAQLALFEMGYENFELIPRDTEATAAGARMAAQSVLKENPQLIIGPLFADSVRAVQTVTLGRQINILSFSTDWTLAQNEGRGSNTYLMGFMPFAQVDRIASYAHELGYKNFGIIAPVNKYGDTVTRAFEQKVTAHGGHVTRILRYAQNGQGLSEKLQEFAKQNTPLDAIFIPVGGSQADIIAGTLGYHDLTPDKVKYLGTGLWDDNRLMKQHNLRGGLFAGPSPRLRQDFEKRYQTVYSQQPPRLASLAYDATALAAVLAQKSTGTNVFNRLSLTNPNGFAGTDGIFRFNQNGLVERGLAVLEFSGGNIIEISPAPRTF